MTTQEALATFYFELETDYDRQSYAVLKSAVEESNALKEQRDDAVIRAGRLQQDVASLKAEVKELKLTINFNGVTLLAVLDELKEAGAEVERLTEKYAYLESRCYDGCATGDNVFDELTRTRADLLAAQAVNARNIAVIVEQMVDLERARPLLEAVEKVGVQDIESIIYFLGVFRFMAKPVLFAALAYKEAKEKP